MSAPLRDTEVAAGAQPSRAPLPVFLKPTSSSFRKPSFYIPRMRDEDTAPYALKTDALGTAMPLFLLASPSCCYYALRLPLLKAGFRRLSPQHSPLAANAVWGRSVSLKPQLLPKLNPSRDALGPLASRELSEDQLLAYRASRLSHPAQKFNHFPLTHANLGCKQGMARNLRDMGVRVGPTAGDMCAFTPRTWFYPSEKDALAAALKEASPSQHFIWKPARGSCGRGICISKGGAKNEVSWRRTMQGIDAQSSCPVSGRLYRNYVVQEYVEDPYLIEGRKMDLRLYVAVTSYDPLTVYLHEEGLVRLAVEAYDGSDDLHSGGQDAGTAEGNGSGDHNGKEGRFRHLTNYSIGRRYVPKQPPSPEETASVGASSDVETHPEKFPTVELKWALPRLWEYIDRKAPDAGTSRAVQENIALLITRTLMSARRNIQQGLEKLTMPGSFFELYGFDVMLDKNCKPWLIEVNTLPSLESSSAFDYTTKTNVVADLLNLAMLEPFERDGACFCAMLDETPQLRNGALDLPPLANSMKAFVHPLNVCGTANEGTLPSADRREVEARLQDEVRYARGFHRIFPASTPDEAILSETVAAAPSPLKNSSAQYQRDLSIYGTYGFLTEKDHWSLSS